MRASFAAAKSYPSLAIGGMTPDAAVACLRCQTPQHGYETVGRFGWND